MNYYPPNHVKKDNLNDCRMCNKFQPLRNNACKTRMPTINCNPNEPQYWHKPKLTAGLDPVFNNVYNGAWLCNYEPRQTANNMLCQRNFEDCGLPVPFRPGCLMQLNSDMRPVRGGCVNKNDYMKPKCDK